MKASLIGGGATGILAFVALNHGGSISALIVVIAGLMNFAIGLVDSE